MLTMQIILTKMFIGFSASLLNIYILTQSQYFVIISQTAAANLNARDPF